MCEQYIYDILHKAIDVFIHQWAFSYMYIYIHIRMYLHKCDSLPPIVTLVPSVVGCCCLHPAWWDYG